MLLQEVWADTALGRYLMNQDDPDCTHKFNNDWYTNRTIQQIKDRLSREQGLFGY